MLNNDDKTSFALFINYIPTSTFHRMNILSFKQTKSAAKTSKSFIILFFYLLTYKHTSFTIHSGATQSPKIKIITD